MTSMPDLNITGSPIYEDLVAVTGDPYQPPAYQLPDVYGGGLVAAPPQALPDTTGSFPAIPSAVSMQAAPEALTQWLGQFLGHGNGNWFAVLVFGGAAADQFQRMSPAAQFQQYQQYQPAGNYGYDSWTQYTPEQMYQAYQWYAAQQQAQAALEARAPAALPAAPDPMPAAAQYFQPQQQPPDALPVPMQVPMQAQPMPVQQMPVQQVPVQQMQQLQQLQQLPVQQAQMPYAAEATQQFGGMLTQDWADWLGQASQTANGSMEEVGAPGYPEERRGGIGGRFGAALRELRGR